MLYVALAVIEYSSLFMYLFVLIMILRRRDEVMGDGQAGTEWIREEVYDCCILHYITVGTRHSLDAPPNTTLVYLSTNYLDI